MALQTQILYAEEFGYANPSVGNVHVPVVDGTWYDIAAVSSDMPRTMYIQFANMPAALKRKVLKGLTITIPIRAKTKDSFSSNHGGCIVNLDTLDGDGSDFDPDTITYRNRPDYSKSYHSITADRDVQPVANDYTGTIISTESSAGPLITKNFFQKNRILAINAEYSVYPEYVQIRTKLTGSNTKVYATVTYDDAEEVTPYTLLGGIVGSRNAAEIIRFPVAYKAGSGAAAADVTFEMASAKFYYKRSIDSSYTSINASLSDFEDYDNQSAYRWWYNIPAFTLTPGYTYNYYLEITDQYGATWTILNSSGNPGTFSTVSLTASFTTYPSGTKRITQPIDFAWALKSGSVDYPQKSASLSWRIGDDGAGGVITITGSEKSVTAPAFTFPPGVEIQFSVFALADPAGYGSTDYSKKFNTYPVNLTILKSPSGSDVYTRDDIYIVYMLITDGSELQKSSVNLYWRDDESQPYTAITGDPSKSFVIIPGDTLPTSSTIQWYLEATDIGGNVYTTTPATFSTATVALAVTNYPSGQNVCSGNQLLFKWTLTSSAGDYGQRSATLYWRTDTQQDYTSVSAVDDEKQILLPREYFHTGVTVDWYLVAVDSGGTLHQTNVQRFSTATSQITPQSSPTAGYTNPREPITFSWYFAAGDGSVSGTASLFWKLSTATNYSEVTATGNSITIPANTLPVAATIDWYLAGADYSGYASQTDVYSFSTAAAAVRAITNYPVNGTVDGSEDITFRWTLDTADGFPPSRVEFAWKLPAESTAQWHIVIDTTTPITEYTVPAGTFPAGQIDWRIRAWNLDSVLGNEGTASFINLIAPSITTASATAVPFSTIAWQCDDQQSYELEIDGKRIGPYFGTEKRYTLTDYLEDGVHSILIRVMGSVGIWSRWAETTVDIHNASEDEIELTGTGPVEAALQWTTESATADFLIYRDGAMIGHTTRSAFSDRLANGEHTYTVINRLASGNYDKSNEVTIDMSVSRMTIAAADGGEWIEIPHALTSQRDPEYTKSKTVAFNHLSGHEYPTEITSELYEFAMDVTAAFLFTETEAHKKFLKLFGVPIIVKAADGSCFVGIISSWRQRPRQGYYTAYTFTVSRIDWEDYVDAE